MRKSRGKWRLRLVFKDFRKKISVGRTLARGTGRAPSVARFASYGGSPVAELPSLVARYASYQGRSSATGPSRATRSSLRARTQGLPFPARDSTLATRRRPHAGRVGDGRRATGLASRWSAIPRRSSPAAPGGAPTAPSRTAWSLSHDLHVRAPPSARTTGRGVATGPAHHPNTRWVGVGRVLSSHC